MNEDIRGEEIKISVRKSEDTDEAIERYMKNNGFTSETWMDGKGLQHKSFYGNGYSELWVSTRNFDGKNMIFKLSGNK